MCAPIESTGPDVLFRNGMMGRFLWRAGGVGWYDGGVVLVRVGRQGVRMVVAHCCVAGGGGGGGRTSICGCRCLCLAGGEWWKGECALIDIRVDLFVWWVGRGRGEGGGGALIDIRVAVCVFGGRGGGSGGRGRAH